MVVVPLEPPRPLLTRNWPEVVSMPIEYRVFSVKLAALGNFKIAEVKSAITPDKKVIILLV